MHRITMGRAAAIGLALAGAIALGGGRPTAAQGTDRFTLFEMFGRVN